MVKGKIIGVAILFIIGWFLLQWTIPLIFPQFGFALGSPWGFYAVLGFSILLAASAFLPFTWGKMTREVAYLLLFIGIILTEINIVTPFISRTQVNYETCTNGVFPNTKGPTTNTVIDVVNYVSCVLTGYYPLDYGVGWTAFYLFYLILPFVFVWVIMYGLMSGMGMEGWFGGFGKNATRILSFIIALYAGRVMLGGVLLDFLGYGAWGLVGVFIAIFIVGGLKHMIEIWYGVEKMAEETRKTLKKEIEIGRAYARSAKPIIDRARLKASAGTPEMLTEAIREVSRLKEIPLWNKLSNDEQKYLEELLDELKVSENYTQFSQFLDKIEKYIKEVLGKGRRRFI